MNAVTNPLHLLVIDDDDIDRERVQRYLARSQLKVITHEAASGEEALRLVRTTAFDCVVLDNQLGDTTGSDLLRLLRKEACKDCPVIIVTGAGNEALVVQTLQDGAADYLSKIHLTEDGLVRSVMRSMETHQLRRDLDDMHRQLERRVEEQAVTIRQRERDLQDILDHASSLIGYWDTARCVRFGNRAHQTWFGVLPEALPGMPVREAIGEQAYAVHEPYIDEALRGLPQLFEYTVPDAQDVGPRHLQAEYRPDVDESGKVLGFYVTITDIGLVKAAQSRVEELLGFVEAVIDNSPIGMAVYKADGQCVLANAEMANVTGMNLDQLRQQALSALTAGHDANLFSEFQATLGDGRPRHAEVAMQISPEDPVHVAWSMTRIKRGDEPHLLLIARDVTEQKRWHENLIEARNAAQEAARITSAFLANMSHEIRTPMNAIVGLSRLALEESLPPSAHDHIERVHDSACALMGILDDVLDYSKIEAGQMQLEHAEIDLQDMLQRVADLFSGRMAQKRLHFDVELAPSAPLRIIGDALRLSQILNNLVGNAVKFTDKGGVLLTVSAEGSMLRFSIRDTGLGIDPERREALFAAFAQGDLSITRRFGGTGLGLSICKQLVDMMGGVIGVNGEPGEGSEFWFTVPLTDTPQPATPAPCHHVLLIGQDQINLLRLKQHLASMCITIAQADNLTSACAHIADAARSGVSFDTVLWDWSYLDSGESPAWHNLREQFGSEHHVSCIGVVAGFERQAMMDAAQGHTPDMLLIRPVLPNALLKALNRAHERLEKHSHTTSPLAQLRQRGEPLHGLRVLLVEDNLLNQMVAQAFLQQAGLEVETLSDGHAAVLRIEVVAPDHFAAILMDMHMPVMDGLEAARQIRRMPKALNLPIIAMTAAVLQEDQKRCEEVGMVDMVTKPILPDILIDTLLKWIPHR